METAEGVIDLSFIPMLSSNSIYPEFNTLSATAPLAGLALSPIVRAMVELHREAAIAITTDGRILAANSRAIVEMGAVGGTGSLFDLAAEEPAEVWDLLKRVFAGPPPVPVGLALRRNGRREDRILRGAFVGVHGGREVALLVMSSALADAPGTRRRCARRRPSSRASTCSWSRQSSGRRRRTTARPNSWRASATSCARR